MVDGFLEYIIRLWENFLMVDLLFDLSPPQIRGMIGGGGIGVNSGASDDDILSPTSDKQFR